MCRRGCEATPEPSPPFALQAPAVEPRGGGDRGTAGDNGDTVGGRMGGWGQAGSPDLWVLAR